MKVPPGKLSVHPGSYPDSGIKLLGHRLGDGHDRTKVAKKVQEKAMALFGQAV